MNKQWLYSKTMWGLGIATILGVVNIWFPSHQLQALLTAALGWAGIGFRDAMK